MFTEKLIRSSTSGSDQTAWWDRLIRVFKGLVCDFVGFALLRLKLLSIRSPLYQQMQQNDTYQHQMFWMTVYYWCHSPQRRSQRPPWRYILWPALGSSPHTAGWTRESLFCAAEELALSYNRRLFCAAEELALSYNRRNIKLQKSKNWNNRFIPLQHYFTHCKLSWLIRGVENKRSQKPAGNTQAKWAPAWQKQQQIRVCTVRSKDSQGPKASLCRQRSLSSDWVDAQADPSLRWVHRCFFVSFVMWQR